MSKSFEIVLAGFGGQGVLFLGKILAYVGLKDNKNVSWLPSYGPEMRGGTANCSVIISDEPIASPLVTNPDILIALNLPSYEKFINTVKPGGKVFIDSSLIHKDCDRDDITVYKIEATKLSYEHDLTKFANVILLGKMFEETKICDENTFMEGLKGSIGAKKAALLDKNIEAINIGRKINILNFN